MFELPPTTKDVTNIKVKVPTTEDTESSTSPAIPVQKVTIPVSVDAWRDLKVHCAREKIKLTETAGEIVKVWVDTNVSV